MHGDAPKRSILIVDDDPNNLELVVDTLDAYGFRVLIARSGERGLERARRLGPELVLLDIGLPGIDGYEVCRRLSTNETTRGIPVIFMTGRAELDDKVRGFDVGAVDYVTKPVSERELLARVRAHLEIRGMRTKLERQAQTIRAQAERIRQLERLVPPGAAAPVTATATGLVEAKSPFARLSKREREVMQLLIAGSSNKEIAYQLSVSQTTVSTHRSRILHKLGLDSLPELIKLALEHGVDA